MYIKARTSQIGIDLSPSELTPHNNPLFILLIALSSTTIKMKSLKRSSFFSKDPQRMKIEEDSLPKLRDHKSTQLHRTATYGNKGEWKSPFRSNTQVKKSSTTIDDPKHNDNISKSDDLDGIEGERAPSEPKHSDNAVKVTIAKEKGEQTDITSTKLQETELNGGTPNIDTTPYISRNPGKDLEIVSIDQTKNEVNETPKIAASVAVKGSESNNVDHSSELSNAAAKTAANLESNSKRSPKLDTDPKLYDIGGGAKVDQSMVEAIAKSRLGPLLDKIEKEANEKRALDGATKQRLLESKRAEKERKAELKIAKQKEKEITRKKKHEEKLKKQGEKYLKKQKELELKKSQDQENLKNKSEADEKLLLAETETEKKNAKHRFSLLSSKEKEQRASHTKTIQDAKVAKAIAEVSEIEAATRIADAKVVSSTSNDNTDDINNDLSKVISQTNSIKENAEVSNKKLEESRAVIEGLESKAQEITESAEKAKKDLLDIQTEVEEKKKAISKTKLDLEELKKKTKEMENEAERVKEEKIEKKKLEAQRVEKERLEKERLEAKRFENERVEKERLEAQRIENERLEAERVEKRIEKERLEVEKKESERLATEKALNEKYEREALEAQEIEQKRIAELSERKLELEKLRNKTQEIEVETKQLQQKRLKEQKKIIPVDEKSFSKKEPSTNFVNTLEATEDENNKIDADLKAATEEQHLAKENLEKEKQINQDLIKNDNEKKALKIPSSSLDQKNGINETNQDIGKNIKPSIAKEIIISEEVDVIDIHGPSEVDPVVIISTATDKDGFKAKEAILDDDDETNPWNSNSSLLADVLTVMANEKNLKPQDGEISESQVPTSSKGLEEPDLSSEKALSIVDPINSSEKSLSIYSSDNNNSSTNGVKSSLEKKGAESIIPGSSPVTLFIEPLGNAENSPADTDLPPSKFGQRKIKEEKKPNIFSRFKRKFKNKKSPSVKKGLPNIISSPVPDINLAAVAASAALKGRETATTASSAAIETKGPEVLEILPVSKEEVKATSSPSDIVIISPEENPGIEQNLVLSKLDSHAFSGFSGSSVHVNHDDEEPGHDVPIEAESKSA